MKDTLKEQIMEKEIAHISAKAADAIDSLQKSLAFAIQARATLAVVQQRLEELYMDQQEPAEIP